MKITININDFLISPWLTTVTYFDITNNILDRILVECNNSSVKKIITNGKLGSVLSDCKEFTQNKSFQLSYNWTHVPENTYYVGNLGDINVMIDPNMRWDDNRIIFIDSKQQERQNKLLRIFNKKVKNNRVMEIEIIDDKGILI
jgi:hypothetical protein